MLSESRANQIGTGLPGRALIVSFVAHGLLIGYLCWQPEPPLINRNMVLAGENGSAIGLVYLPTDSSLRIPVNEESRRLKYNSPAHRRAANVTPPDRRPSDGRQSSVPRNGLAEWRFRYRSGIWSRSFSRTSSAIS
jgi:hypothetical protein